MPPKTERSVRTARGPKDSRVHDFAPTSDPSKRVRVPNGEDLDTLPDPYIERFVRMGEAWGRRQLQIDGLNDESHKKKGDKVKNTARRGRIIRGLIIESTEEQEGLDLLVTPSVGVAITSEGAFRRGNLALFQETTHPEWVFQLRIPDGLMGLNGPITKKMVEAFFQGMGSVVGMSPDDFDSHFSMVRRLNEDREKIRAAIRRGEKVSGVKQTETWSIDAKAIPPSGKG